jgi:peroxiredoxin
MKNKVGIIFLLAINLALVGFVAFLINSKEYYKNLVPYIPQGDELPRIAFLDENNRTFSITQYQDKPVILFIFERPCSTCTKNIIFWNKIFEIANKKAYILGVIQDQLDMIEIAKYKRIPFKLISPVKFDLFKKKWRIHFNLSQSYLIYKNKVRLIKVGDIDADDMREIIGVLNELEAK